MRASILTQKRAKVLRRAMTQPEKTLWSLLRRDQQQLHFRRQHAVGPYILEFYCAAPLVIRSHPVAQCRPRLTRDAGRSWPPIRAIS